MSPRSHKVTFPASQGHTLAARLELPEGVVRGYAVFAHCFTCSKDVFAAQRISRGLAGHGIAVLRFDFTGLGASGGDFANTDFSSNVDDLLAAAEYLRQHHEAPRLLVGHSLGGAAVLAAAGDIPEATGVATIGAPADAEHVLANFACRIEEIEAKGEARVELAGRTFTIRRQFLDDLRQNRLTQKIADLKRALLVFHAPRDGVVGIENATRIFAAAKHPKSFVSLDDADHLLTRREDAGFVADVLAAWAARYLGVGAAAPAGEASAERVRVAETGAGKFQQSVISGRHRLMADEPVEAGGLGSGPSPYDFLAIALGACTSMTLRLYAEHKGLELGRISVEVEHDQVHAKDCAECEGREGRVDRFERRIAVEGGVARELEAKLVEIAGKCPVHRTLEGSSVVATSLARG